VRGDGLLGRARGAGSDLVLGVRDGTARVGALRVGTAREGAPRDGVARVGAAREGLVGQGVTRVGVALDGTAREGRDVVPRSDGEDLKSMTPFGAFLVLGSGSRVRVPEGRLRAPPSVGLAVGVRPDSPRVDPAAGRDVLVGGDTTLPGEPLLPSLSVGRGAVRPAGVRTDGRAVLVGAAGEVAPGREGARTPPSGLAVRPALPHPGIARGLPWTVGREGAGATPAWPRRRAVRPSWTVGPSLYVGPTRASGDGL